MAFHIKDPATDAAVRRLARLKGKGLTETIREAVESELRRERAKIPLAARLRAIAEKAQGLADPKRARAMSKADIDALWGQ